MNIRKSEITFDVNGKLVNAYTAAPSGDVPGVLVLPSWWGLKPFFREVCDRLAEQGYLTLAPDYYGGRVAATIDEAKALQGEAEGDPEAMGALIDAAKDHLVSLRPGKPIVMIGFSMGTDWALLTASKEPAVSAIVLFYGYYMVEFKQNRPRIQGHFAEKDEWQPVEGAKQLEQGLKDAGLETEIYIYPGASHWFMEEDRPEYDAEAARLAWQRTMQFLQKTADR